MASLEPTVYVVDDDAPVRNSLCWLISSAGLRVEAFASADEFLDALGPNPLGCALIDVRMPGMSGLRLQKEIRDRYPGFNVIVMSAFDADDTGERAIREGAFGFLEKPVDDDVLLAMVHNSMGQAAKRPVSP